MGSTVAIIAGNGQLPVELAHKLETDGHRVFVCGIIGEADTALRRFDYVQVEWEKIGHMFAALRARGVQKVTLAGGVIGRPQFRISKLDWGTVRALPSVLASLLAGDNEILTTVMSIFEKRGFSMVGVGELAPELLVEQGLLTKTKIKSKDLERLKEGVSVTHALGPFDVGQACVVLGKRAVAIEGVEGTDAMLERVAEMRKVGRLPKAQSGVLVKVSKPGQDLRADLPTIGPQTIDAVEAAGLMGIGLEAQCSLILDRAETIRKANEAGIFIYGLKTE